MKLDRIEILRKLAANRVEGDLARWFLRHISAFEAETIAGDTDGYRTYAPTGRLFWRPFGLWILLPAREDGIALKGLFTRIAAVSGAATIREGV